MEQADLGQPDSEWWRDPDKVYAWWEGFRDALNFTNPDHPDYIPGLENENPMTPEEIDKFLRQHFPERFHED